MSQAIANLIFSAYLQMIVLIFLAVYFFSRRRDPRLITSGINLLRTVIMIAIFIYFVLFWASSVNPSMRGASVFGMLVVNLYMLYYLILNRLEASYRVALEALGRDPQEHELMHEVWRTGKKYFYADYFFSSLYSGHSPWSFLHEMAADRVRDDIRYALKQQGTEKKLTTLPVMVAYLRNLVDCDREMPQDFKDVIDKAIEQFAGHPWIEENVNNFLALAIEAPEDLHYPEWKESWEKCITSP